MIRPILLNPAALLPAVLGWPLLGALGCQPAPAAAEDLRPGLRPGAYQMVLNGVRLWYRVAGEAPADAVPVVFWHGGPGQGSAHFDALAGPCLEPSLRMVYFDQRGSGHSERPWTGEYSIDLLVDDLEELRQHLSAPRIVLVGYSFGGLLGLEYAKKYPERASALVVAAGLWSAPLQCRLRLQRPSCDRRRMRGVRADTLASDGRRRSDCELEFQAFSSGAEREAYNLEIMFPDPTVAVRMDSVNTAHGIRNTGELGRAIFEGGLLDYRLEALERVTAPVLVIAGRHDGAALPAGLRDLARLLPNARYAEYDCRHFSNRPLQTREAGPWTGRIAGTCSALRCSRSALRQLCPCTHSRAKPPPTLR